MSRRWTPPPKLEGAQLGASDPAGHAALSASAGTGKTHVLTSRVLRLLLQGAAPQSILCLTYTKAGAAEMANRIAEKLSRWVRLPDARLKEELRALGEPDHPPMVQRARRLFAKVLEAPGGLRIQTIHSFSQALLASFPVEAGLAPGFRPIEGRAVAELARRTLANLLAQAEASLDERLIRDVQALSLRLGEQGAIDYLMLCARPRAAAALAALGEPSRFEAQLRALMGVGEGSLDELLAEACDDGRVRRACVERLRSANLAWGTKTGLAIADTLAAWLAAPAAERVGMLGRVTKSIVKSDGSGINKVAAKQSEADADYALLAEELGACIGEARRIEAAVILARVQAAGLRAGAAFAAAYASAKRQAGVADFDDLIAWTRRLLDTPGMGDWVRYKLDQRTDHVLVDEAQDTNSDQWAIVEALAGEFFSGQAEAERRRRTLFMVGDYKQAIYGFQGTDPREFDRFRGKVAEQAGAAEAAARAAEVEATLYRELSIDASFRSAPAVLELVDEVIALVGAGAMGLSREAPRHVAARAGLAGEVEWWPPFEEGGEDDENGEEGWIAEPVRRHADAIARQVAEWLAEPFAVGKDGRPLGPGDILILVRSRSELAALIVARLYARGVPVAGIDRLLLSAPLAVKDLISAVKFAVQPLDDLNLASLLVSPIVGLDHQQLEALAMGRREKRLWPELQRRREEDPAFSEAHGRLAQILAMADQVPPAAFLEQILSGPIDGRARLLKRLGEAARDPIEELVASALDYERQEISGLDHFLAWFAAGDVEVARDAEASGGAVRVMTVHGSKGLEAPLVLLADATFDPAKIGRRPIHIMGELDGGDGAVPLVRPRAAERMAPFDRRMAEDEAREREEHWRLLYVALTRAAQKLVVAGVKKKRDSADSWHSRVKAALAGLGAEPHPTREGALVWRGAEGRPLPLPRKARRAAAAEPLLPDWVRRPAPEEARPPRPLAPSALVEDRDSMPPPSPELREAARRGTLLHALFERLPGSLPHERAGLADRYLERAGIVDGERRAEMIHAVAQVMDDPRFAALFGPEALAEAPIAATLGDGRVVAGTVDLLLVEDGLVRVIDFKTGRQVPDGEAKVPRAHRVQMDAYREAMAVIFPGRRIEAALLYTAGPRLIEIGPHHATDALHAAH